MYILKNALRSIGRAKGRNILIGIIALIIAISACVALSIKESANTAREDTLNSMSITAQISLDRTSLMSQFSPQGGGSFDRDGMKEMLQNNSGLTLEEYNKYAESSSVSLTYYSISASLNATDDLEPVDTMGIFSKDDENETQGDNPFGGKGMQMPSKGGFGGKMGNQGDFTVVGYSNDTAMTDFASGAASITSGAVFDEGTQENNCIISEELATYNNLEVGSEITLANPNDDTVTVTLSVVGIYKNNSESNDFMGGFSTAGDSANKIYMSYNALNSIIEASKESAEEVTDEKTGLTTTTAIQGEISYTYVFKNIDDYNSFLTDVKTLGLDESYTVSSSDITNFENSLTPLNNLSKMATYFLAVVFGIGAIILIVINIFNIRERKYEIGVLTSIGMKKSKVALQFVTELFVITLAAIIIGAGIGAVASVPVTNTLLAAQIESNKNTSANIEENFGRDFMGGKGGMMQPPGGNNDFMPSINGGGMSGGFKGLMQDTSNYISQVSYSTNLNVVLQLIVVGVLLTLISSLAAVLFIMRYEPLKILSSRD